MAEDSRRNVASAPALNTSNSNEERSDEDGNEEARWGWKRPMNMIKSLFSSSSTEEESSPSSNASRASKRPKRSRDSEPTENDLKSSSKKAKQAHYDNVASASLEVETAFAPQTPTSKVQQPLHRQGSAATLSESPLFHDARSNASPHKVPAPVAFASPQLQLPSSSGATNSSIRHGTNITLHSQ